MLKLNRLSLFALVMFGNPAMANCVGLLTVFPDLQALTKCVQQQEMTISGQARDISLLRKELDYLKEFQRLQQNDINKLSERAFSLRLEVEKLRVRKANPAN